MKSKVKLVLLLALVLTVAVVLSACGSKKSSTSGATATPTKTQVAKKVEPTNTPKPAAKPATATPTPTTAAVITPSATEGAQELEKIKASEEEMKKILDKFDSYKIESKFEFVIKLKDGSEKKSSISVVRTVVNKPEKKLELTMEGVGGGMDQFSGLHVIATGNKAWMKMGENANWMEVPVSSIDDMIKSMGGLSPEGASEFYAEKSLQKGTKKFGPVKCKEYEFDKHDLETLVKKYPKDFSDSDKNLFAQVKTYKGSGCVTDEGIALTFSASMVTDDPAVMALDNDALQKSWGITKDQIKEMVVNSFEGLIEVNKNYDIKPPKTGG
jgi:hypothetical protein